MTTTSHTISFYFQHIGPVALVVDFPDGRHAIMAETRFHALPEGMLENLRQLAGEPVGGFTQTARASVSDERYEALRKVMLPEVGMGGGNFRRRRA